MVTVEPITPTAAAILKAMRLRALKDSPTAFGSTYAMEAQLSDAEWKLRAEKWNGDRAMGYLALDNVDPCGIVGSFLDENTPTTAHLVSMWVAPSHRRCGVGRVLIERIIDWAGSRGVDTLRLMVTSSNDAAIRFYEGMEFKKTGHTEPYPNDPALLEYEMIRSVNYVKDAVAVPVGAGGC
jgi:ribosomal protein S18 acetylase RimI-like enzyme